MTDSILIVDDEEPVRRTFEEWLGGAGLNVAGLNAQVFAAADAEAALKIANEHPIDLAILDWNLGAGLDGLRLLEDLALFRPDIVAILVTGFAAQATPLDALRMGVRDYLDKSTDLTRESFLAAVRQQLDRIRPAKRQREFNQSLAGVPRSSREGAADRTNGGDAERSGAAARRGEVAVAVRGALRRRDRWRAHPAHGRARTAPNRWLPMARVASTLPTAGVSFSRSLAASVLSRQAGGAAYRGRSRHIGDARAVSVRGERRQILAAPLPVGAGTAVVLELFDKPEPGFSDDDRKLVGAAAEVGGDLIRQAIAERQSHRLLFDAVEAALQASNGVEALPDQRRTATLRRRPP